MFAKKQKTCLKCGDVGAERGHLIHWKVEHPFGMNEYEGNEGRNAHTENALLLTQKYGTQSEAKEMKEISNTHNSTGYINNQDYDRRCKISNKYYKNLLREHRMSR